MEHYKSVHPVKYYEDYLAHNVRPDGRKVDKFRQMAVSVGCISTADGSSVVRLGNTKVTCGIKAELAQPLTASPNEGFLVINSELPPLCCSEFKPGPPSDVSQKITAYLNETFEYSGCIDLADLCIVPDKLCWVLYCDLVCCDYDGCVTDAYFIALLAALRTVKLPKVSLNEETSSISVDDSVQPSSIKVHRDLIAVTCASFNESVILMDPNREEEQLSCGLTTVISDGDVLYSIHQQGGSGLTVARVKDCMKKINARVDQVKQLLDRVIGS